jgi:hypothetical protein
MKKIFLTVLMLSILIPVSVFAATPSDEEVFQTTSEVLGLFAQVMMTTTMLKTELEGVTLEGMDTGQFKLLFDNFNVQILGSPMGIMGTTAESMTYSFTKISGVIEMTDLEDLSIDVDLTGSNIKNLIMKSENEDLVTIKANGKSYNHLAAMLMAMDEEM